VLMKVVARIFSVTRELSVNPQGARVVIIVAVTVVPACVSSHEPSSKDV
jgi:hypothetical protein